MKEEFNKVKFKEKLELKFCKWKAQSVIFKNSVKSLNTEKDQVAVRISGLEDKEYEIEYSENKKKNEKV
jgi:hypothetical protein